MTSQEVLNIIKTDLTPVGYQIVVADSLFIEPLKQMRIYLWISKILGPSTRCAGLTRLVSVLVVMSTIIDYQSLDNIISILSKYGPIIESNFVMMAEQKSASHMYYIEVEHQDGG